MGTNSTFIRTLIIDRDNTAAVAQSVGPGWGTTLLNRHLLLCLLPILISSSYILNVKNLILRPLLQSSLGSLLRRAFKAVSILLG